MRIDILTLFPEMCKSVFSESILGRAIAGGKLTVNAVNIRNYTLDKHNRVDDTPYGGGMGMLMQAQPIYDCYKALCDQIGKKPHLIYMSPQGKTLTQKRARELSSYENIAILCGHYEGVDERVLEEIVDEEISIGDYVLTGGELPALVLSDCIARMVDGVLPNEEAYSLESHYSSLLEHPQYTKPYEWNGKKVPDVLISGHHANIEKWKREQSLKRTYERRPDLLNNALLSETDKLFIDNLKQNAENLVQT
ncbi:MAG: tRNA (guanosine(37)-N1)-methyltransferase TrmD [Oscillospiraceae bacterium]|nr:tRNA (guanosine(37)-N1)-methyltransferase TrmD [Oscillospiraceae bacterium]